MSSVSGPRPPAYHTRPPACRWRLHARLDGALQIHFACTEYVLLYRPPQAIPPSYLSLPPARSKSRFGRDIPSSAGAYRPSRGALASPSSRAGRLPILGGNLGVAGWQSEPGGQSPLANLTAHPVASQPAGTLHWSPAHFVRRPACMMYVFLCSVFIAAAVHTFCRDVMFASSPPKPPALRSAIGVCNASDRLSTRSIRRPPNATRGQADVAAAALCSPGVNSSILVRRFRELVPGLSPHIQSPEPLAGSSSRLPPSPAARYHEVHSVSYLGGGQR